jgi:RNase_H superfamily/AAA domain
VVTTAALAALPLPMTWKPERGAVQSYERLREQARLQVEGRAAGRPVHELLPVVPGFGLTRLPPPSKGDISLDFEGDPFVSGGGLEFLFGYAFDDGSPCYTADWAVSRAEERAAFEKFIDFVQARLAKHPDLHVYHFAPYEPAALKRLMGRYATRENELDQMLRAGIFVDLYAVVRHAIRASVESYSIKKLEPLYAFTRSAPLEDVGAMLAKVQACLELGDVEGIDDQHKLIVQNYNQDDCLSTWRLREWLEGLRDQLIASGTPVERPEPQAGEAGVELTEWQARIADLIARLTRGVPLDQVERTPEQHARWLLAYLLDFHRREKKSAWWEYFRLAALSPEDLMEERSALGGLEFVCHVNGTATAPVHRYSFPAQETQIRGGEQLRNVGGARFGKVEAISLDSRTVDIKKRRDTAGAHPAAVFAHEVIDSKVLAEALVRIGEHVAANGMTGDGPYRPARDLLMLTAPRIGGRLIKEPDETTLSAAVRIAPHLAGGVFPIQGPPGAGKTHTGAHMACTLARSGKRVGITANSHKVIRNLLDGARKTATETGFAIRCVQKVTEEEDDLPSLQFVTDNAETLEALEAGCHLAGGTAWLWARPEFNEAVDVLFVDEAAQMCLANVLAVSQAARNVVLLGDPRQLEQPIQGSHPEGTEVSALDRSCSTRNSQEFDPTHGFQKSSMALLGTTDF